MLGPLIVSAVLYVKGGYQESFAFLLIPACLSLGVLLIAFKLYPHPHHLERKFRKVGSQSMCGSFFGLKKELRDGGGVTVNLLDRFDELTSRS